MEESFPFHYSLWEYLFSWVGLLFFLLDIVMDILTVVSLYQEENYVSMGLMIFFLLGSSVLLQVFSWIWYSDSLDELETEVEKFAKEKKLMKPFHFLQLGVYLRYTGLMEISTTHFFRQTNTFTEGVTVYLSHDLQMLRLFEAFAESAPQLILMMTLILQRGELEILTGLKLLSSVASIASTVAMYHRSMRAFLEDKRKMSWTSTAFYFLWNFLLMIPRVAALALFCSVFPCYIVAHFLSLWMVLVLVAWSQKTDLMKSHWEWLYRATVGLIWYFSWFNVSEGSIKLKSVVYYSLMGLDTIMLLGFWCWKVVECADGWIMLNPYIVVPTLLGLYVIGIVVEIIYYKWFHPNCDKKKISEPSKQTPILVKADSARYRSTTDFAVFEELPAIPDEGPAQPVTGAVKRSRTLAANFF
ncbi:XK-related protein 8-like [Danio aesculapii]|uniref:XK-related protein 8-like n=1 Tax=Danio aesculapii TaxID=1142201 RepID=UPI0024C09486|nr:XK-related protein 8-like [Danio aesculapii]